MKSKYILFGSVLSVFLMMMIPNTSAINTQLTENKLMDSIELKSDFKNFFKDLPKLDQNILRFENKLANLLMGLGCLLSLANFIVLGLIWVFCNIVTCMLFGFFGGLTCGEPIKRTTEGFYLGIMLYISFIGFFAEGTRYYLIGDISIDQVYYYAEKILLISGYLMGKIDERPF